MQQKYVYYRRWILFILKVILLALLFGFVSLGTVVGNGYHTILSSNAQRTRVERLTKDAYILLNNPPTVQRLQAISEIQNVLPDWQKTQRGLLYGDPDMQLPSQVPSDIAYQVALADADYTPLYAVFQKIATRPSVAINSVQLQIIAMHEYPYFLEMGQVNLLWRRWLDGQYQQYYWIETVLIAAVLLLASVNFYSLLPHHKKQAVRGNTGENKK